MQPLPLGPIMLDLADTELSAEDHELLRHPAVGGVILFTRNYHDPEQLAALTQSIRALRSPELLIAADQEGGRVQRFRNGFRRLPPAAYYGELYRESPHMARKTAQRLAWLMASELQAVGVDFSFAPVLDIDYGINPAISDRAFNSDAHIVTELTTAWLQGTRLAGMASVGKHFPGHGGVTADSHRALPTDTRTLEQLSQADWVPFQRLIDQGLEAVMPAHILYPAVDELPAGFSGRWLKDILRKRMGFQGVIVSDALDMAAAEVAGDDVTRAQTALSAGCDLLLMCNNRGAAIQVVDALHDDRHPAARSRLLRLYSRHFTPHEQLQKHPYWAEALRFLSQYQAAENKAGLTYDPTTRGGTLT